FLMMPRVTPNDSDVSPAAAVRSAIGGGKRLARLSHAPSSRARGPHPRGGTRPRLLGRRFGLLPGLAFLMGAAVAAWAAETEPLPRTPPLAPAAALASFEVAPGFRLEQVAAEPLVTSPVAMAFDENGRLFVAELTDYGVV